MQFNYFEMETGDPIYVSKVGHLRSPRLKELFPTTGIGYRTYELYLSFLLADREKMLGFCELSNPRGARRIAQESELSLFDTATLLPQTRELCREVLSFFMVEDLVWNEEKRIFVAVITDDDEQHIAGEINRSNFEEVRRLMLSMNYIGLDEKGEPTHHSNQRAKELWERAQKFLKEQSKNEEHEDKPEYHLGNIISKLCASHPSYNFLNVFELTVFQLYDAFFQYQYLRASEFNERIFSIHGGDKFKYESWLQPTIKNT